MLNSKKTLIRLGVMGALALMASACSGVSIGRSNSSTVPATPTQRLFQEASTLQSAGKLNAARADYLKIVKLDPLNKYAYYDLGVLYQATESPSSAATAYEKSLLVDPNYVPALFNLAIVESTLAPDTAIVLYQRLEQLQPKNASVYFNLGLLYKKIGSQGQGDQQLETAVALNPSLRSRIPTKYLPAGLSSG